MKKILLSVIVTVCVMTGIGYGVIHNITQNYEKQLVATAELIVDKDGDLELKNEEIAHLKAEQEEVAKQVIKMKDGESYSLRVSYDGKTYSWSSDGKKLFGHETTSITY